ncbi:MAG TPA: Tad domain-containing protein [Bryobacteraceae bacterium]|nr:Tad domain-containing protein [Bryobacteraceae bacterium]
MITCVALTILLGFAALAIDIARMYVIQSELQAFTDAAALRGAMELDGGAVAFRRARDSASGLASGPHAMKWDLGTKPVSDISESFAQEAAGSGAPDPATWTAQPRDPAGYRFVRVVASAPAPLVFLRIFEPRDSSKVAASSIAVRGPDAPRLVE